MTDRERNTFTYQDIDIAVEADIESVSGISFLIKDPSIPGNSYFSFAYFDNVKQFISCGCDWDSYVNA